ncbi:MAG: hypothetical protein JO125_05660 [Chloroflexi bacterium]|nr:hypothetical protein [Ktedonobacteraceae bacterium]MBV8822062.1 hypothetical protein [Ktedonobacteraceae bacterium]MBV9019197.1 hypothetical protein [Ktedonobacteraceae bacterium]MBV9706872.1 hypothetical protein [Chloroflexota bacterium]
MWKTNKQERSAVSQCSFCGKSQDQVDRLTAGPLDVSICNECVDFYRKCLDEAAAAESIVITKHVRVCSSCGTSCPESYRYCFNCGAQFTQET